MKLDLTKPLKREVWMKKNDKVESVANELKKLVYGGVGIKQNEDPMRRADEMYGYYKLFKKLDTATPDTEYTPDELNIIFGVDNRDFANAIRVLYNSFVK